MTTIGNKVCERTFRLEVEVPFVTDWVWETIEAIETTTLKVFDPSDPNVSVIDYDEEGAQVLDGGATLPVDIHEWLAVGCQHIGTLTPKDEDTIARYSYNAHQVLMPFGTISTPAGPAAFVGRIDVAPRFIRRVIGSHDKQAAHDAFCFVIAHELVHVFDMMQFVVPAVMNWESFWVNVLKEGSISDSCLGLFNDLGHVLDRYETELELARVKTFWGTRADTWFEARKAFEL